MLVEDLIEPECWVQGQCKCGDEKRYWAHDKWYCPSCHVHLSWPYLQARYFEACGFTLDRATGKWQGPELFDVDPESIQCKCIHCKRREEVWERQRQRNMIDDEVQRKRDEDLQE